MGEDVRQDVQDHGTARCGGNPSAAHGVASAPRLASDTSSLVVEAPVHRFTYAFSFLTITMRLTSPDPWPGALLWSSDHPTPS